MNSLSWLFYASQFREPLMVLASLGIFLGGAVFIIGNLMRHEDAHTSWKEELREIEYRDRNLWEKTRPYKQPKLVGYFFICLPLMLFFLGTAVPSETTVTKIAISELGEKAIVSPEMQKLLDDYIRKPESK